MQRSWARSEPRRHSRPAPRPDVRLRPPGDRGERARAADPADGARAQRRGRSPPPSSPRPPRWPSGWCARRRRSAQAGIPFSSPARAKTCPTASPPCSTPSMPHSPKAGPIPQEPTLRDATSRAKPLFLARLAAELMPDEPEALGLAALMFHAEARRRGAPRRRRRLRAARRTGLAAGTSRLIARGRRSDPPRGRSRAASAATNSRPRCSPPTPTAG